jgi:C4-dicarboxylate-specific signal transduction histidine kinase
MTEASLGPAMRALTEKQQAFVNILLDSGSADMTACAEKAGYAAESRNSLHGQAHRLAHSPKVQAAIHEESLRRLATFAPLALRALADIAMNHQHKDRLRAAQTILDRVGLHATHGTVATVTHEIDDASMTRRVVVLCAELGLDPARLLGQPAATAALADPDTKRLLSYAEPVNAEWHEVPTDDLADVLR